MNPTPADVLALHLNFALSVTIGELAEQLHWPRRMVEQAITDLRLQGRPVCTGPDGVWLARSAREMEQQYQALRRRYISQALTARAVRSTARRMAASEVRQTTLWDAA